MKKLVAITIAAQIGTAQAQMPVFDTPNHMITSDMAIFAKITKVTDDDVLLQFVHTVSSIDGRVTLFSGDTARAILEPFLPGNTRRGACVQSIRGKQGTGVLAWRYDSSGKCLATLHDFEGAAGLENSEYRVGSAVRVVFKGDLIFVGEKK